MARRFCGILLLAFFSASHTPVRAQTPQPAGSTQTVEDVLHRLFNKSGVVFAGQVLSIRHVDGEGSASGIVEIQFRIDTAIRGCENGSTYTVREWNGLWLTNAYRYAIGQRLLMFLYAPGASGMSSPVEGLDGAIPVRQGSGVDNATAQTLPYVDLRWLGTRIARPISYRQANTAPSIQPRVITSTHTVASTSGSPAESSIPDQQASVLLVLNMLATWQKGQQNAQ